MENPEIISERSCNGCTLCCKILSISELEKPQGEWCKHCTVGKGCSVYESRPAECSGFFCGYLTWSSAGQHWLPSKSKMVIVSELDGGRIAIHVDPGWPAAWRAEPFLSDIRSWAFIGSTEAIQVVICVGNRAIVVLPEREVDLGPIAEDERIVTVERSLADGSTNWEAYKLKANDPQIAGMEPGKPLVSRSRES